MKKIFLMLFVAVMAFSCGTDNGEITVMTYNIRQSGMDDGDNHWDIRKPSTITMFNDQKPDLVGMQEVVKDQFDYVAENMPEYGVIGTGRDDGKNRGEMMAVMYLKERFELLKSDNFWLSETPDEVSRGWDGACNRMVTWLRLKDKVTGKEIFLFNTHLDHRGELARAEGSKLIVSKIKEIAGDNTFFLTGDFNAAPADEVLKPIASTYPSAREEAPQTDNRPTFNGWGRASGTEPIDHIYYQNATPLVYEVVMDGYGSQYVSDHYPVKTVFEIK